MPGMFSLGERRPGSAQAFFASASRHAAWLGATVADALLPPHCVVCAEPVLAAASLCSACWTDLELIESPLCERLGTPFARDEGAGAVSAAAIAEPPPWGRSRSAVAFGDTARSLVHGLKYHDRHEMAFVMARMMARAGKELLASADFVVPVPLHRARLWGRRFNQSALLARHVCKAYGHEFHTGLLRRVRKTQPQVGLDQKARARNLDGAFQVPARFLPRIEGRHILLIDDVMTTGATAREASDALRWAGAAGIDVLTFALVLQPARVHIS